MIVRTQPKGTSSIVPRRRPLIRQKRRQCSRMGSTSQDEPGVVPGTDCHRRVNAARRRRSRPRSDQARLPPSSQRSQETAEPSRSDQAICHRRRSTASMRGFDRRKPLRTLRRGAVVANLACEELPHGVPTQSRLKLGWSLPYPSLRRSPNHHDTSLREPGFGRARRPRHRPCD